MVIKSVLKDLFEERKIFHSEADFQLALYRKIINIYKNPENVYLEYILDKKEYRVLKYSVHLDILITNEKDVPMVAIELKYATNVTKSIREKVAGQEELFRLKLSGHTYMPYSFWNDVRRLEIFQEKNPSAIGYVIFLTNRSDYRDKSLPKNDFRLDKEFTFPANKKVPWKDKDSFSLLHEYNLKDCWTEIDSEFMYLLLRIPPG